MKKKKENSVLRTFIQAVSFAFHNGYLLGWTKKTIYSGENKAVCVPGLNCYSCPGAVGACPMGSLQAMLDGGHFKASLYVISFIAMIGILCGRLVCGFICPFGFIQDLLNRIPLFKKEKNMPGHKYLKYLRFVILGIFVIILPTFVLNSAGMGQPWFCEWICPSGTLLGGIPLVLMNETLQSQVGFRFFWKVALLIAVIVLSVKYFRPFCKYICPLGALYGLCNPISTYRIKVDESKCVKCAACQGACGMDIKVWEKPNSMDCIRCGKCVATCPKDALSTTWGDGVKNIGKIRFKSCAESVDSPAKYKKRFIKIIFAPVLILAALISISLTLISFSTEIKSGVVKDIFSGILYIPNKVSLVVCSILLIILAVRMIKYSKDTTKDRELLEFSNLIIRLTLLLCVLGSLLFVFIYVLSEVGLHSASPLVDYVATPLSIIVRNRSCIGCILLPTLVCKLLFLHKREKAPQKEEET